MTHPSRFVAWGTILASAASCAGGLAIAAAATALSPQLYTASARLLLPPGSVSGSRVLTIQRTAADPVRAKAEVELALQGELASHPRPVQARRTQVTVLDAPMVLPDAPRFAWTLPAGGAAGLILGAWLAIARARRRFPVATERDLVAALGPPLLAAQPLREDLRPLARRLLDHWLVEGRTLLPVVSAERGAGRTRFCADLARAFASLGEPTLLVDADLRSPGVHRCFGLSNTSGFADLLKPCGKAIGGRSSFFRQPQPNLAVLAAGRAGYGPAADPLLLLSEPRLGALLAAASRSFRVVIVDTPAAGAGPDLQIFAALAGGAVVLARHGRTDAAALGALRAQLSRAAARVVAVVLQDRG